MEKELHIEGMHCVSCEGTIKKALERVPGVEKVDVSFVRGKARVVGMFSVEQAVEAVRQCGYEVCVDRKKVVSHRDGTVVLLSALLTAPLIASMFIPIPGWLQLILASIVQFGFGWRFYVGSFWALKTWTGNMDLLICLGTSAAYFFSAVVVLFGLDLHLYFEASAAIITLVLLGRFLESLTKRRAGAAIGELVKLQPKRARVQRDGEWVEVDVATIEVGTLFQVRPGEQVPVDGVVVEGSSHVDESLLTGESVPVKKGVDDVVIGGTQNARGALVGRATAVGSKTALAEIIRLVEEAESSKAPIQQLADRVSAVFVPVVVLVSLITFFAWWGGTGSLSVALINSVAVLVIACPCALGMATPTVIMVASGKGAQEGILIRNAEAIELAGKVAVMALDKTGTLTEGKPEVVRVEGEGLEIAAALEEHSEHPLGVAIRRAVTTSLKAHNFEAVEGKGVRGVVGGKTYFLGSVRWMKELGLAPASPKGVESVVVLADGERIVGTFAIADRLRPHSKEGVERLHKMGIETVLLSGDHPEIAEAIAHEVGIDTFEAEVLPGAKASAVSALKEGGRVVGMVGDGINDAPALTAADVGFAMRSGTDVAMESADVTLMQNDIRHVAKAVDLSRATFRKVRQNLFFAFIYNALGIPLAAFGLLNPIFAGAAMAASSVSVVANALHLNRWRGDA